MSSCCTIGICHGKSCCQKNQALVKAAAGFPADQVIVEEAQCLGLCEHGPNIRLDLPGKEREKHTGVTVEKLEDLANGEK